MDGGKWSLANHSPYFELYAHICQSGALNTILKSSRNLLSFPKKSGTF